MTVATYTTRLTPFILFGRGRERSMINFIAKNTPPMVMTILVIYMLKGVNYLSFEGIYTFIAILVTVVFHLYKRNALVSIIAGTAVYMVAVQI
jgi:branched-subunit amino acid transport protein AzlD